jgi:hypothetical protein
LLAHALAHETGARAHVCPARLESRLQACWLALGTASRPLDARHAALRFNGPRPGMQEEEQGAAHAGAGPLGAWHDANVRPAPGGAASGSSCDASGYPSPLPSLLARASCLAAAMEEAGGWPGSARAAAGVPAGRPRPL